MDEIWKDIKDYEGLYQVSNLGNIKSLNRETIMETKNQHCKFKCKKIIQLYKKYKIIKIWKCMSDVHRELGIPVTNLSKCCRRHNLTARNCYWRYYDEKII